MPDPINVQGGYSEELALLLVHQPRIAEMLVESMHIVLEIDPVVAEGALGTVALFLRLTKGEEQRNELAEIVSYNSALLHTVLRAKSLGCWEGSEWEAMQLGDEFAPRKALDFLRKIKPEFGGAILEGLIDEYSARHRPQP